ncbi:hypothetical protein GCM10025734_47170 [Kitasatospora paranensis]
MLAAGRDQPRPGLHAALRGDLDGARERPAALTPGTACGPYETVPARAARSRPPISTVAPSRVR